MNLIGQIITQFPRVSTEISSMKRGKSSSYLLNGWVTSTYGFRASFQKMYLFNEKVKVTKNVSNTPKKHIYRFETSTIQKLFTWNNIIWPVYTPGACVNRKPLTPKMLDFENQRAWKFHQCWIAPESCLPRQFVIFLEIHRDKNMGIHPISKQFHLWPKLPKDENSVCWLRTPCIFGGSKWSSIQFPLTSWVANSSADDWKGAIGSDWVVGMLLVFNCSKNSPLVLYVINNPC